ncbi:MAG: glycoside hydrolase family 3 protein [Eggerthellaceae bacterium]|nr:glycoside hydrolase family 3 protein [Eggerthellaceae bacterium]
MSRRTFAALLSGTVSVLAFGSLTACSEKESRNQKADGEDSMEVGDMPNSTDQEYTLDGLARQFMESLTLEQKVAQLFFIHPESLTGIGLATEAGDATREAYTQYPVGGVIYLAENLEDPDQTTRMLESMAQIGKDEFGYAPFISVDEEGGTVVRVADNPGFDVPNVGDMCDVGNTGDVEYAEEVAKTIAGYLLPLGFNTDFAPCCDVANNPESDTMLYRSFGSDAQMVADMVSAQVRGFGEAGILCCAKHFPGIGAAVGDSHDESIFSQKTLEEIDECELVPFKAAIDAGVPMVMVSHMSMPEITGDDTPASISGAIVTDILRNQLRYDGIVITDSLGMGAVSGYGPQAAVMALQAGCDMPLMPEDFLAAYQAVLEAVADGTLTEERIDESLLRIMRVKLSIA